VRRVVEAPADAQIAVYRPTAADAAGEPTQIQLTTDPNAPVYGKLDPDVSHPYRQKEVVAEVNRKLPGRTAVNAYDIQCFRKVHKIDEKTAPQFCHLPKFGSMQYSDAFIEWVVEQHAKDKKFFKKARDGMYDLQYGAR
jgi:EC042_2821-lke REase